MRLTSIEAGTPGGPGDPGGPGSPGDPGGGPIGDLACGGGPLISFVR